MLDLRGRRTVVVGGGKIGARKASSLRQAGAKVTVVARETDNETDFAGVEIVNEPYRRELLQGASLVFACTDDRALNATIARDAREMGILANVADQPEDCDFFLPAVWESGQVVAAIGTGGASPTLAGWLRDRVGEALPERIGEFAALLAVLREEVKERVQQPESRRRIMRQLGVESTFEQFAGQGEQRVRQLLDQWIAAG